MKILKTRNNLLTEIGQQQIACEIGVFKGEFSEIMLNILQPDELHLIDIFEGKTVSGDKDGNNVILTDLDEEYNKLLDKYYLNDNVIIHKGKSKDVLSTFKDEYFDLIYIDGDHSYNAVKEDLELAYKKVKNEKYICGHDYTKKLFPGVVKAVDEFCNKYNLIINYLTEDGCPSFCIIKK